VQPAFLQNSNSLLFNLFHFFNPVLSSIQLALRSIQSPLRSIQLPLSSIQWALRSIQWALSSIQWALSSIQSPLRSIQWALRSIQLPLSSIQLALRSIQSPLFSTQPLLFSIQLPLLISPADGQWLMVIVHSSLSIIHYSLIRSSSHTSQYLLHSLFLFSFGSCGDGHQWFVCLRRIPC
jgi:hypothetical protein